MSLQLDHDFTFNPDGSGRVAVRWSGPLANAPAPADFVRSELERARGVDAWADVACEPEGDRLVFRATAWFRDVAALRFHCQGFHVSALDFRVDAHDDGSVTLASSREPAEVRAPVLAADARAADVAALLAAEREKLAMARGFLDGLFGSLTCRAVLRLPAPIAGRATGVRLDERTLQVEFDGAQLVALLDRLATDDALMTKLLLQGGLTPDAALELLGEQGPVSVRTLPGAEPQFDWDAEVGDARARFAAFAEQLQATMPPSAPAEALEGARIVAAKVVLEADGERDLCPQGQSQPGVTLTLAADLPASALELDEATLERAIAGDGTELTPVDEWDRRCHFPKLTKDGRTALLELSLPVAGARAGLRELRARFVATISDGNEEHDLGFPELAAGAAGTVAGAQLQRCEVDGDGHGSVDVQLQVARQRVLGAAIVGADGWRVELEPSGYSSCNDECTLSYRWSGEVPVAARLVMTFATGLSRRAFAVELRDVDWLGRAAGDR
jgi:hypothetical protein